jgi:hypothetical protein
MIGALRAGVRLEHYCVKERNNPIAVCRRYCVTIHSHYKHRLVCAKQHFLNISPNVPACQKISPANTHCLSLCMNFWYIEKAVDGSGPKTFASDTYSAVLHIHAIVNYTSSQRTVYGKAGFRTTALPHFSFAEYRLSCW